MRTLAIVNQKGGVGKTTAAVTLAHGLAWMYERRVLLVDLDAQGNVADALGLRKVDGLYQLLVGGMGRRAISVSGREGLEVILGNKRTAEVKIILAGRAFRERALWNALEPLGEEYDVCVLDVAPGVDVLQIGALVAADYFLIPAAMSHFAVIGVRDAVTSAMALKRAGALKAQFLGVLPMFWERTTREGRAQFEAMAAKFKNLLWPPIPRDTKAREAPAYGKTLWEYAPYTRALSGIVMEGKAVGGYHQVLTRLVKEMEI